MDTSKVLLYTVVIEDMSREIENHSSSSMCGHRSISQNTYMSFVWACLNTQFTSSVLHYVRPCLFVPWVVYTQASVFAAPPYIELLATNLMSFWGITTSTCSTISQQIWFDFLKFQGGLTKPAILYFCSREIAIFWNSEPLPTTRTSVFFWGRNLALSGYQKKIGFFLSPPFSSVNFEFILLKNIAKL